MIHTYAVLVLVVITGAIQLTHALTLKRDPVDGQPSSLEKTSKFLDTPLSSNMKSDDI